MASGRGRILFRVADNSNMSFVDGETGRTIGLLNGVRWLTEGFVAEGPGHMRHAPPTFQHEKVKWAIESVEE